MRIPPTRAPSFMEMLLPDILFLKAHNDLIAQMENNLYTKLISLNTLNFDHD